VPFAKSADDGQLVPRGDAITAGTPSSIVFV
jgi:hypothetical protein